MSFQDKVMNMFASMESRVEALAACMEARDQEVRQELALQDCHINMSHDHS